jgi:ankyrin repeat protein
VVDFFMNHGSNANPKDKTGRTPISLAASMGHFDTVNCFLEHKIDPNTRDTDNRTPLSWAAYRGHLKIVKALLAKGADPEASDEYGRTPLLWASYEGWVEVVELLRERDVDIETRDRLGRTALSWASENGHVVVVKLLLEKGARLDSMDAGGRTPLAWAIQNQQEAIRLLLKAAERSRDGPSRSVDHTTELKSTSSYVVPILADNPNSFATGKDQMPASNPLETNQGNSEDGRCFQCPLCNRASLTSNKHVLQRHVRDLHFPRFRLVCPESDCSRTFQRKDKFMIHMKDQHQRDIHGEEMDAFQKEEPLPEGCIICQRQVTSWEDFYTCIETHVQAPSLAQDTP